MLPDQNKMFVQLVVITKLMSCLFASFCWVVVNRHSTGIAGIVKAQYRHSTGIVSIVGEVCDRKQFNVKFKFYLLSSVVG